MRVRTLRLLAAGAMPLLLGGCLTFGSIEGRGTNINEGVSALQNRGILLNLVRASRNEPLYFTTINQVQATGSADLKLTAPVMPTGHGLTNAQKAFSWSAGGSTYLDNSTNTNFTLQVYSTHDFYAGMLAPLGLTDIDLLLHQGFPRELVFYLVIDRAKLTNAKTGKSVIVYNDPTNPANAASYKQFVLAIESAMQHGLTTEVPVETDAGAPVDSGGETPPAGAKAGAPAPPAPITVQTPPPPTPELCFERALATDDAMAEFKQLEAAGKPPNYCGSGPRTRAQSQLTVQLFGEELQVEVTTRSIYGIFRYLGQIMASGPLMTPQLVDYGVPGETTPTGPLLEVRSSNGPLNTDCFSAVSYEGAGYCVPDSAVESTKDIFNVLSLLVALKQTPGALPQTAAVLITP